MISQELKYALRGAVALARADAPRTVKQIASEEDLPARFLEQIFLRLRRAGLIESRRGRGGGYRLARSADEINFGDVARAIRGAIAPLSCLSRRRFLACSDCPDVETCVVRRAFAKIAAATDASLTAMTLADAVRAQDEVQASRAA